MLNLYGHPMSTCTRKVLMTLEETGLPFQMNVVDFATGDHKKAPHIERQPFGRIPTIEDDGFSMFESRAIARYVNDKAGGKLAPSSAKGRAKMEQWISVETSEFTPNAMKFIYNYVFKRPQEASVLEAAGKALETVLGVMDKDLASAPYLAGADFSLADLVFMPYLEYAMNTPLKDMVSKYPHVSAWWSRIRERDAWKKAIARAS